MAHVIYSDININSLNAQTDGDWPRDININAVKNSIRNILRTQQGTRRMLPTFASSSLNLLFEPIDNQTSLLLGESIFESILLWDDRVDIQNVNVNPLPESNAYIVDIQFSVKPSIITENVSFTIDRLI